MKPALYPAETQELHTVCVTGATGFLGSNLVARLLAAGHTVHGAVRDPSKATDLEALPGAAERLKLFKADLLQAEGFKEAMQGCSYVFHTAAVFTSKTGHGEEAQRKVVDPAVKGTEHVLGAVNETPSVRRVVLTSSCVAVAHSHRDKPVGHQHTEEDWNTRASLADVPYNYAKTLGEKKAWEIAGAQTRWDLVVINPPLILGPPVINRSEAESIGILFAVLRGEYSMACPFMGWGVVDVRDVAAAHMLAAFIPTANGRNITCGACRPLKDIVCAAAALYPKQVGKPKVTMPEWAILSLAPFLGVGKDVLRASRGGVVHVSGAKAARELGLTYITMEESVKDMCEACDAFGMIKIKK